MKPVKSMSYSFMETFLKCPLQHHFKYAAKKEPRSMDEHNMNFGNLIHGALEMIRKSPTTTVDEALRASAQTAGNRGRDMSVGIDVTPSMMAEAREIIQIWLKDVDMSGMVVQTEWHFDRLLPGRNFNINGYIDLVENMPDGLMRITDYKTGYTVYRQEDVRDSLQLMMYAIMALAEWHPPGIEICYDMVRGGRVSHRVTKQDVIVTLDRIDKIHRRIEACTDPKPKLSSNCGYCAFNHICPAFQDLKPGAKDLLVVQDDNIDGVVRSYKRLHDLQKAVESKREALKRSIEEFMTETNKTSIDLGDVRASMRFSNSVEFDPDVIVAVIPPEDIGSVMTVDRERMNNYLKSGRINAEEESIIRNRCRTVSRRGYVVVEEA